MSKRRILEIVDSEGNSIFVPQHKSLGMWWNYQAYPCGRVEYTDFDKCKADLQYISEVEVKVHDV